MKAPDKKARPGEPLLAPMTHRYPLIHLHLRRMPQGGHELKWWRNDASNGGASGPKVGRIRAVSGHNLGISWALPGRYLGVTCKQRLSSS
jgi:hypothetical protein